MRIRKAPWLALLVVALLLIVALLPLFRITPQNRTYIIGWDVDPPDQVATNSGEPTGFAVELVREAAKRRGIRLRWVLHLESSEAALRSKAVDLWPMMVITKDRKQILHLTDPYQENQYGLFVDAKSAFTKTGDLKQRTISYDGMPFNGRLLRLHFPGTVHLRKSSLADAVRSVCVGEAEAVFADRIAAFSLLLSNQPCPSLSLRMLPIVTFKTELGIGATRESRAAADAIREEMGVMAGDGSLGKIMSVWSYDSGQELDSLVVLQRAKTQLRWYRIGLTAVAALFLFASWAAAGYRQQRIKAQGYGRALGQAERNVRLVADSLSEMVVAYDMHRSLTYANSGAEKLTGYGLGELPANPESWTHPEDRSQVLARWDKVFEGQTVDQIVYRLITKNGTVKWAAGSWGLVVDEAGRQVGVRGTCRDITERIVAEQALQETTQKFRTIVEEIAERKRVEQALRKSEERLKTAERLAHVGNWEWDFKADRLFWSEEACRILGRPENYTTDYAGFLQAVQPDDRERVVQYVRDLMAAKRADILEFQITRPDGGVRTLSSIAEVVRDERGVPVRMSGAWQDITDQKRAEAALRRSLDEIAHLNRVSAMGELTSSLAHELNQPLAAILSNAQAAARFLSGASPDLKPVRECLIDIVVDDKRAGEVIRKLRALLKKGEFQATLVDLNEVVHEVIRLLGHDALLRKVSVKFEPLARLPLTLADRVQLSQVVLNLIMNGLDAVAERPPGDRWVSVRTAEVDGGRVELTVEDSGKGIAECDLSRLFEPFFTTKQKGLGMGLSISRSIVQAHGGRIWAESVVRGGAIFRCVLPATQYTVAAAKG